MMRCGILAPGLRHAHRNTWGTLPLQVTEYGKSTLKGEKETIWDPAGFLDAIRKRVRHLSHLELSYLEESVRAFHLCLYRASLVMLGAASEALMSRVVKATAAKLPNEKKIKGELDSSILLGVRAWKASLEQNSNRLPGRAVEALEAVDHIFDIIRRCRNGAAHPKRIETNRLEVQTLLLAFGHYGQSLLALRRAFARS
jgi:hypothetical protein